MPENEKRFTAIVAVLFALVVLILYAQGLTYPLLTGDDHYNLDYSAFLHPVTRKSFTEIWSGPYLELYIPVTLSVWAVLQALAESLTAIPRPALFHGANLLLHWANSLLVFLLLRELLAAGTEPRREDRVKFQRAAAIGALLFCVHPLQIKGVAWITGMKDVLSTFFALLCLRAIIRARVTVGVSAQGFAFNFGSWRAYFGATLFFVLSLLSKPNTIVLPVLALLVIAAVRQDWRKVAPFLLPWLACGAWLALRTVGLQAPNKITPVWLRGFGALDSLNYYATKLFFPYPLAHEVTRHAIDRSQTLAFWLGTIAALLVLAALTRFRPRDPLIRLGLLFAGAALLPILGLVPYGHQNYSDVSPHYMYLPLAGVALVLAALLTRVGKKAYLWALAVPLTLLAAVTFTRVPDYESDDQLLGQTLKHDPGNLFAHANLAVSLTRRKSYPRAIEEAFRALELQPDGMFEWQRVAQALVLAGAPERAIAFYKVVLLSYPNDPHLLYEFGFLQVVTGHVKEGAELIAETIRASAAFTRMPSHLAYTVIVESADPTAYEPALKEAVHLAPNSEELKGLLLLTRPF